MYSQTRYSSLSDPEQLRRGAEEFLFRSLASEACLLFAPSQVRILYSIYCVLPFNGRRPTFYVLYWLYTVKLLFYKSLCCTVTARGLDSDGVVTVNNCRQHGDWAANGSVVPTLPAVNKGEWLIHHCPVTILPQCSVVTDGMGVLLFSNQCWFSKNPNALIPLLFIRSSTGCQWPNVFNIAPLSIPSSPWRTSHLTTSPASSLWAPAYSLRSSTVTCLHVPKTCTLTGDRAFSSSVPCLWNNLPAMIRGTTTTASF